MRSSKLIIVATVAVPALLILTLALRFKADVAAAAPAETQLAAVGDGARPPTLALAPAASPASPASAAAGRGPIIGFNLGYATGVIDIGADDASVTLKPSAQRALDAIQRDGFSDVRVMGLFSAAYVQRQGRNVFPALPASAVQLLTDRGLRVLINIDSLPFLDQKRENGKWVVDSFAYRKLPGTDDGPDDDGGMQELDTRLHAFIDELARRKLMDKVSFELFNEPDGAKFFSGTVNEYSQILHEYVKVFRSVSPAIPNDRLLISGFTSSLVLDYSNYNALDLGEYAGRVAAFRRFLFDLPKDPELSSLPLSFHWYPRNRIRGAAPERDPSKDIDSRVPVRAGSWVTEFNVTASMMSTYRDGFTVKGKHQPGYRETHAFSRDMQRLLDYANAKELAGIYVFKLTNNDDAGQARANGAARLELGLFDENGCPQEEYGELISVLHKTTTAVAGCAH